MTRRADLTDADILKALTSCPDRPDGTPTYVLRNILSPGRPHLKTASVRTRLQRLERSGRVVRTRSSYTVMLSWRITDAGQAIPALAD